MIPVMDGSWNSGHSCNDRHALEQLLLECHSSTGENDWSRYYKPSINVHRAILGKQGKATMLLAYYSFHVGGEGSDFGTKKIVCIHHNTGIYRIALAGVITTAIRADHECCKADSNA